MMLATTELRQKEKELAYERGLLRKQLREIEGEPTQVFVTSAYKRQQEENRIWEEKIEKMDSGIYSINSNNSNKKVKILDTTIEEKIKKNILELESIEETNKKNNIENIIQLKIDNIDDKDKILKAREKFLRRRQGPNINKYN